MYQHCHTNMGNSKNQIREFLQARQTSLLKLTRMYGESSMKLSEIDTAESEDYFDKFQSIINSAVESFSFIKFDLPINFKNDCMEVVRELGGKIWDWIEFVGKTFEFDYKFAGEIYFLPDGTIDENKIFTSWENNEEFINHKTSKAPAIYILSCFNVREDFIMANQDKMGDFLKSRKPDFDLSQYDNKFYTLMAKYIYLHTAFPGGDIFEEDALPPGYIIPPLTMLSRCAHVGFKNSALYFFSLISEGTLVENTIRCLRSVHFSNTNRKSKYQSAEIILTLVDEMTSNQKIEFFQSGENVCG